MPRAFVKPDLRAIRRKYNISYREALAVLIDTLKPLAYQEYNSAKRYRSNKYRRRYIDLTNYYNRRYRR